MACTILHLDEHLGNAGVEGLFRGLLPNGFDGRAAVYAITGAEIAGAGWGRGSRRASAWCSW